MAFDTRRIEYQVPKKQIGRRPLPRRGLHRMFVVRRDTGRFEEARVADLPRYVREAGLEAWVNDSHVARWQLPLYCDTGRPLRCRIYRTREDGAHVAKVQGPLTLLCDPKRRFFVGPNADQEIEIAERTEWQEFAIRLPAGTDVNTLGRLPTPTYVRPAERPEDEPRYQPLYATRPGGYAVATAGVDLSERELDAIQPRTLTLHADPGNSRRVGRMLAEDGDLLAEPYAVPQRPTRDALAIGTTALKALESAERGGLAGTSGLYVKPGFEFKRTKALFANLRFPRETATILIASFIGIDLAREAMRTASAAGYLFGDYGDGLLIL